MTTIEDLFWYLSEFGEALCCSSTRAVMPLGARDEVVAVVRHHPSCGDHPDRIFLDVFRITVSPARVERP